jgi:hypothetical protein
MNASGQMLLTNSTYINFLVKFQNKQMILFLSRSKEKDTKELQEKLQNNEDTSKTEEQHLQKVILNKEKELYNKDEQCKYLKSQVEELGKRGNETKVKASNSQEEIKVKAMPQIIIIKNYEIVIIISFDCLVLMALTSTLLFTLF